MRTIVLWASLVVGAGCMGPPSAPPADFVVALEQVVSGLDSPLFVTHAGDGSGRLFVLEQPGVVRIARSGSVLEEPFLDIRARVGSGGERGLLGLAFEPAYAETGRFYVSYTDREGDSVVARYEVDDADPDRADQGSAVTILTQDQPYSNHNGGMIAFGPDGFLYVGFGDGGSGGDPHGNGQKRSTWLGKILRIDVVGKETYEVPAGNPFPGDDWRPEIWAYGLRNPWRFSFDQGTGDLWIADVGQNAWEEIDRQTASSGGGENYGWNVFEGTHRFRAGSIAAHATPVYEYPRSGGHCAVTGGYVYRGDAVAGLKGRYVFADYCSGIVSSLATGEDGYAASTLVDTDHSVSSFGEDENGDLLLVDHGGAVYRFVPG